MVSLDHKIPPPVVGLLVAAGMWSLSAIGPQIAFAPWLKYVTIAILAATGLAIDVLGLLSFHRARTTVNPLKPERVSAIVTSGVYRFTRNPMYLGMAMLLLAWSTYLSALLPFAGPAIFVLYITRFQIQPEEKVLKAKFGDEYAAYASRVRRWL